MIEIGEQLIVFAWFAHLEFSPHGWPMPLVGQFRIEFLADELHVPGSRLSLRWPSRRAQDQAEYWFPTEGLLGENQMVSISVYKLRHNEWYLYVGPVAFSPPLNKVAACKCPIETKLTFGNSNLAITGVDP